MISASGIALADAVCSFLVLHGLDRISSWGRIPNMYLDRWLGALFLVYGMNGLLSSPPSTPSRSESTDWISFLSTFGMVVLNPGTFVPIASLFALAGLPAEGTTGLGMISLSVMVAIGTIAFWSLGTRWIERPRGRLSARHLDRLARGSSIVIVLLGLWILVSSML